MTLAASLVMAGSGLLVLSVFERLGTLRSLESRTAIERFLSQPPGSDLGITTETVLDIVRTVSMVAAGLATAAAVLGFHVLKGNKGARIGLSVLAAPLFFCGLVTGGFLASVVAASVAMLWLAPSRLWFSGEAPPVAPGPLTQPPPASAHAPPAPQPWTPSYLPPAAPPRRPGSVVAACAITWVCCGFAALVALLLIGVLAVDADGLFAELHRQNPSLADQGVSDATLEAATWVTAVALLLWALVSSVLAVFVFRRARWAVVALIVSAGLVAMVCLVGSLASPALALPGVLAAVTGALLLRSSVHRWLDRRRDAGPLPRGPWA